MIDTMDTIDTGEFKPAPKVVSMVTLSIDTIDTKDRHQGRTGTDRQRRAVQSPRSHRLAADGEPCDLPHGVAGARGVLGMPLQELRPSQ